MAGLLDTLPPPGKASALDDLPPPSPSSNGPRTYPKRSIMRNDTPDKSVSAQVADLIEGTGKYSSGALIPAAILSPLSTVAGLAGGYAAGKGAKAIASKAEADEDQARLAEDAGNIVGGGIGAKFGPRVLKATGDTFTLPKWVQSFRDNFAKRGPAEKPVTPVQRNPGWKNIPEPETGTPAAAVDAIPASQTPSGRKPGSLAAQQEQERLEPVSGNKPLPLWHSVRDRFVGPPTPVDPIPASQTPSGRKPGGIAQMVPITSKPVTSKPTVSTKVSGATQTAADLMQTVGITPETMASATPEQWKMIEQHSGGPVDRQAAISYLKAGVADAAANRAARGLPPAETVPVLPDQARAPIRVRRR